MRLLEEFHTFLRVRHNAHHLRVVSSIRAWLWYVYGLADPVSSGKYSGTFVFTATVAEPTVMSFTVPLNVCTIDATATVVASYSSSADMCCESVCVVMSCGGWFRS